MSIGPLKTLGSFMEIIITGILVAGVAAVVAKASAPVLKPVPVKKKRQ